jgi:hypothetical protein
MHIGPFKFNLTEEGKLFQKENKINGQHYGERSRVVMKGEFIYFMLLYHLAKLLMKSQF